MYTIDYFEDPETFNPDRYMKQEFGTKPGVDVRAFRNNISFGYGRVCLHDSVYKHLSILTPFLENMPRDGPWRKFTGRWSF